MLPPPDNKTPDTLPFLQQVAHHLYARFGQQIHTLAVVFPNRRQSRYFTSYLQQHAKKALVMPECLTIEELVARSSSLPIANPLMQLMHLHNAYARVATRQGLPRHAITGFEKFYPLAEVIIADFKDLDTYLADVSKVYSIMEDTVAIDQLFDYLTEEQRHFLKSFWAGATDKQAITERFLQLWKMLPQTYVQFHEGLRALGFTTLGQAYRQLALGQPTHQYFVQTWQHIAFVGFNALNKAEETIILRWQQQGFASLWMDADTYYVNNPEQEAGLFIRQNLQRGLRNALPVPSNIAQRTKPIQIAGVQSNTAQAKLIAPWLQSLPAGYQNAAILLANEQMLLPVLQSLPAHLASHINITMGYPLAQTAVYNLLLLYLDVQIALQNNQGRSIEPAYIQRWLMHSLSDIPAQEKSSVQDKLIKESWVYMPVKPIQALSPQAAQCFTLVSTPIQALDEMLMLLEKLQAANGLKEQPMEQAALSTAWQALQQALQQIQALQPPPSLTFIRTLVERYLGSARIAFEAGSSQGIQIMGLLESRGLHFDHILILDAAEGYLPQIKAPNSYLPQHIRQAFGLPVIEQQDAIYAYSFYRLLHYHPTLLLVYNRLVTDSSTGEPTRFIRQLKYHTNIPFEHSYPQWPVMPAVQPPIAIPLSPAIQARLRRFLSNNNPRPLSPSAINSWLYCRLQFFYQYMAGLAKPETLSNSIDAAAFGEIVHKVMEVLYQALLTHQQQNPLVTTASIAWMRTQIEAVLPAAISQAWKPTPKGQPFTYTGQWLLVKEVVTQYVQEFLNEDEAYAPFTLKELEVKFDEPFGLMVDARPQRVMLKGIIDRVDEKEGLYRMLDYKTGNDTPQFKSLEGLFERDGKHNNKAALQTLLYSWMFSKKFPEHARFQPALVALRQMKRNKTGSTLYAKQNRQAQQYLIASNMPQTLTEIEQHLRLLLEELFDPNLVFTQTNQPEKCKQCDFASICGRH